MCAVLRGREKRITAAVADPAYHTLIGNKGGGGGTRQDENVLQSSSQVRRLRFVSPPPMPQAACIQAPTHTVSKPHRVLVTTDSRGRAPQCVPVFKYSATLITSPPGQQVLPSAATASPHSCWVWFLTAGGGRYRRCSRCTSDSTVCWTTCSTSDPTHNLSTPTRPLPLPIPTTPTLQPAPAPTLSSLTHQAQVHRGAGGAANQSAGENGHSGQ
jgi:hypothetical protein